MTWCFLMNTGFVKTLFLEEEYLVGSAGKKTSYDTKLVG